MEKEVIGKLEKKLFNALAKATVEGGEIQEFLRKTIGATEAAAKMENENLIIELKNIVENQEIIQKDTISIIERLKQIEDKNKNSKINERNYRTYFDEIQEWKNLDDFKFISKKISEIDAARIAIREQLPLIYKSLINFQLLLGKTLEMDIVLLHTEQRKPIYFWTYQSSEEQERLSSFLKSTKGGTKIKSKDLNMLEENLKKELSKYNTNEQKYDEIASLIKEAIANQGFGKKRKQLSEQALDNEEDAYDKILKRLAYSVSSKNKKALKSKEKRLLLWINNQKWEGRFISNRGPVEETRQYFLLQIHRREIYNLFKNDAEAVEETGQAELGQTTRVQEKIDIFIHNYVYSKYGIKNVDNRSGLIIDDHLIETKYLLERVKEALQINQEFVSIGSKTGSANFTSYKQYLQLLVDFKQLFSNNESIEKKDVKKIFKKFFLDGSPITREVRLFDEIEGQAVKNLKNNTSKQAQSQSQYKVITKKTKKTLTK